VDADNDSRVKAGTFKGLTLPDVSVGRLVATGAWKMKRYLPVVVVLTLLDARYSIPAADLSTVMALKAPPGQNYTYSPYD
jgi:hypothetical protein